MLDSLLYPPSLVLYVYISAGHGILDNTYLDS